MNNDKNYCRDVERLDWLEGQTNELFWTPWYINEYGTRCRELKPLTRRNLDYAMALTPTMQGGIAYKHSESPHPMNLFNTLHAWLVKLISNMNRQTSSEQQERDWRNLIRREARKRAKFIRQCEQGKTPRPTAPTKSLKKGNTSPGS